MGFPAWLIISALLLLTLVILFRTVNQIYVLQMIKENFFWFFAVAIFAFFSISLVYLNASHDLDYTTYEGLTAAGKIYLSWAVNVFRNIGGVTGYIIQQDWIATNSSG